MNDSKKQVKSPCVCVRFREESFEWWTLYQLHTLSMAAAAPAKQTNNKNLKKMYGFHCQCEQSNVERKSQQLFFCLQTQKNQERKREMKMMMRLILLIAIAITTTSNRLSLRRGKQFIKFSIFFALRSRPETQKTLFKISTVSPHIVPLKKQTHTHNVSRRGTICTSIFIKFSIYFMKT